MSTVQLVHRVIQKARASGQAMTITDHMYDADIHQEGRGPYNDVHKALREGLMPGRPFAQWAGTVFLPDAKKKRPEAWAKNRGFQVVDSIRPEAAPFFEHDFRDQALAFIEDSDAVDVTSPRKLPPDQLRSIANIIKAEYPQPDLAKAIIDHFTVTKNNIQTFQATIAAMQATIAAMQASLGATERAMDTVKTLKSDFKRLTDESRSGAKKSDDPDPSDESPAETAGGRVTDAMDAGSPVH